MWFFENRKNASSIVFYSAILASIAIVGCRQTSASAPSHPRVEITEADLFSVKDWDSSWVEIWGLHIGMSRIEANLAIRKHNLELVQRGIQFRPQPCVDANQCEVWTSGSPDSLYAGPTIRFNGNGEVLEMMVPALPDYAVPEVKQVAVTGRFKGQTFAFFNGPYSDDLRLKFFGPETAREMVSGQLGDKIKDTNYTYSRRGITINASPRNAVDPTLDLVEVRFYLPGSSHRD